MSLSIVTQCASEVWCYSTIHTDDASLYHTFLVCIYDPAFVCGWVMLGEGEKIIIVNELCIKLQYV